MEGGEADANRCRRCRRPAGVPSPTEDFSEPDHFGARFSDSEVQRVVDLFGEQPVGRDRIRHVRRLDRHLEVLKVHALHELDELDGAVTSASTGWVSPARAGVWAGEPELTPIRIGTLAAWPSRHLGDLLGPPMLRVEADAVRARVNRLSANVWLKWMSAITGIGDSLTTVFRATTSSSRGTATRTMSHRLGTLWICSMVGPRLAVSVLVIV